MPLHRSRRGEIRAWVVGVLIVLWLAFVASLLVVLAHFIPVLGGPQQLELDAPRVGAGWGLRQWFLVTTVLWALILGLATVLGRALWKSRGPKR